MIQLKNSQLVLNFKIGFCVAYKMFVVNSIAKIQTYLAYASDISPNSTTLFQHLFTSRTILHTMHNTCLPLYRGGLAGLPMLSGSALGQTSPSEYRSEVDRCPLCFTHNPIQSFSKNWLRSGASQPSLL